MREKNTVLQQLMSELGKAKEEIKSNNKNKAAFIGSMSHILRTPLNTIIGYSEMLQEDAESTGLENYNAPLKKVIESARQLIEIVNDIFDLSIIEAGKMEFFLEDINLENLAKELEPLLISAAKKNNNTFTLTLAPNIDVIHTDIARIRQLLLNLLSNANKFTCNGTVQLDIKPVLQDTRKMIKFTISDTGKGITPQQLQKLSESLSHPTLDPERNFGAHVGLYLSKRLCEMMGGWITVESEEAKGSIFSVILPFSPVSGTEVIANAAKFSEVSVSRKKTILIIDNTLALHHDIQTTLGRTGFTLLHAFDGEEGLKFAKMTRPDVIILDVPNVITLDVMMPLMDGWATLSALKGDIRLAKIPVIVISLVSEEHLGFNLKDVEYLHKPVHISTLTQKIKSLIIDEPAL